MEGSVNIKSAAEIALMREAGRINAEALEAAKAAIAPGVTTAELNEVVEAVHRKYGVYSPFKNYPGPYPFPASICTSVNEELVHGIPGNRKLKEGDIISVDCGTVYQGFVGDSAFTVGVGEISPLAQRLIEVTRQALDAAIAQMVPGNHLGDIGAAVEGTALKHGFYVTHLYTGHGVGREMHESPLVPNYGQPGQGMLLREGMTLAIEPMLLVGTRYTRELKNQWTVISRDRSLTAHQEHTVAITANGPEILTRL
ncbi:MAG: type I methionyl aminopeptidase [Chloroflexi bacterium]|jgi:methionyl aminopeptidase|nr:type I methionyl aminopeptidase [Chloroflexota bacterium]HOE34473.1 type I methionyl aminopeptidase [Anaerolineaceae bacterium]HOT25483.1 type I methionyl aminopeptidase [Anaerolineaceae bacterium]HQH57469.1 type I methionyl aminopeptidase [Anaerolineaceae bacterium]HQK04295.1 type I methionyl aminopeptidase [Anaerolineaceae bacterium]